MASRKDALADLEDKIGHRFAQRELLVQALRHTSVRDGGENYQRLEFLGDRVLGLIVAEHLYGRFADAKEGELSRKLSEIVRKETCADVADGWDVGVHIVFGPGVARVAARSNRGILADVCEAIIGAAFIDGGYAAARAVVENGFGSAIAGAARVRRDPKTMLQEWAQARGLEPPAYEIADRTGPEHAPQFRVRVTLTDGHEAIGTGASRRAAEQEAAQALMATIGSGHETDTAEARTAQGDKA